MIKKICIVCMVMLFLMSCKTAEKQKGKLREAIEFSPSKHIVLQTKDTKLNEKSNVAENISIEKNELIDKSGVETKNSFNFEFKGKYQKIEDLNIIEEFIPNVNAGIMKVVNNKLWLYLDETMNFYDQGWYIYDYKTASLLKATKTYFDIDIIEDYKPKYNKEDYFYFKKIDFDKLKLFYFNKEVSSWLISTFNMEITDTNVNCIAVDEVEKVVWFSGKNFLKKYDIKREVWSEPFKERLRSSDYANLEIRKIIVEKDYDWFIPMDCNLIIHDKKRDIWKKHTENACDFINYITSNDTFVWFKSNVGILQFNKISSEWYEFDVANFLGDENIRNVFVDNNYNFWIETRGELNYYNNKTSKWKKIKKIDFSLKNNDGENYFDSIYQIKSENKNTWITTNNAIILFNLEKETWLIFDRLDLNDKFRKNIKYFDEIFVDSTHIWFGTNEGVFRLKRQNYKNQGK